MHPLPRTGSAMTVDRVFQLPACRRGLLRKITSGRSIDDSAGGVDHKPRLILRQSVFQNPFQIAALRAEGYRIVATTPHRESCTPETFDVARGPFALVFGTEHAGISDEAMAAADEYLRIPMCGLVESLNVSASAAILLYMLSQRVRSQVEGWQLPAPEAAALRLRWMQAAVRDAEAILARRFPEE